MYNNSLTKGTILKGSSYSYEIVKILGQGSFGITYLASVKMAGALGTIDANIKVAIKEFFMKEINGREGTTVTSGSKDGLFEDYRRKFVREAKNLSKLRHPNIVNVLEAFETNNTCYYVMEYMDGGSLDELIAKRHGLSEEDTVKYSLQIASALAFMHSNKMLHLDLKPKNIMMNNGNAVLIDFGLSKQYNGNGEPESSTTVGTGTPGYAPIEQANYQDGNGFPVTMDIYALGATMFKMLTGERPPIASDILNDGFPSQLLKDKSQELAAVVEKAMQPMRKQRIQTVEKMKDLLAADDWETTVLVNEDPKDVVVKQRTNTINGHEYVDLGLSVKWATCNVGAERPSDYGDYFAWGEITPKSEYTEENSVTFNKIMRDTPVRNMLWRSVKNQRDISGDSRYDAARANWGGTWRLPTVDEIDEFIEKCECKWTTQDGHNGHLVTGPNGKSIFLPASGWRTYSSLNEMNEGGSYWSSTPNEDGTQDAYCLDFDCGELDYGWGCRDCGCTVRPVSD